MLYRAVFVGTSEGDAGLRSVEWVGFGSALMTGEIEQRWVLWEWAVVAVTVALAVGCAALPASVSPAFVAMFEDFGAIDELPMLTRWVLAPVWGVGGAVVAVSLLALTIAFRRQAVARRVALISAGASALLVLGVYLYAIYSPIFAVAEEMGPYGR